jgi:GWxTD domain-containing protein
VALARPRPVAAPFVASLIAAIVVVCCLAAAASAAWLKPVDGDGDFYFTCDAVNLANRTGGIDVAVLVAIPHRQLVFEEDAGRIRGRVRATVRLIGDDGATQEATRTHRLTARNDEEADSPTLQQQFVVVLPAVTSESGRLEIVVEDLNRRREGLMYLGTEEMAQAMATADWYAPPTRETRGLAVGDAVFLAHAPIRTWEMDGRPERPGEGGPWDFINALRRYGLEAEAVQLYFTIEPPARVEDRTRAARRPLLVQIQSDELDFSLVDTIRTTAAVQRSLGMGQPAAVYWEMDAGGLPPGTYRLGLAPLDDVGRSLLTTFRVVWDLGQLARPAAMLLGEGRTVLLGAQLTEFEEATLSEKEQILDEFWAELDPTPQDPFNELRAEFYRRISHVQNFLGGFDETGARDPRGRVYLLLGEPDGVREEALPMNENTVNAARDLVFDRFQIMAEGSQGTTPWAYSDYVPTGRSNPTGGNLTGFVPQTYMADVIAARNLTQDNVRSYLFWSYDEAGRQLFVNSYTGFSGGLRFFFVDETGIGKYKLDASNTQTPGD